MVGVEVEVEVKEVVKEEEEEVEVETAGHSQMLGITVEEEEVAGKALWVVAIGREEEVEVEVAIDPATGLGKAASMCGKGATKARNELGGELSCM